VNKVHQGVLLSTHGGESREIMMIKEKESYLPCTLKLTFKVFAWGAVDCGRGPPCFQAAFYVSFC
jgi:hypothetical protein